MLTRSPENWLKQPKYSDITIMDPDGWDRRNFAEDWAREITEEEFNARLNACTIRVGRHKHGPQ